jgi:hypothetical protein
MAKNRTNRSSRGTYWATEPPEDCVRELVSKKEEYYRYLNDSGMLTIWADSYNAFYKAVVSGPYGGLSGQEAEFQNVHINDFRNLILHKVGLVIAQKPTFEPMAVNSDIDSLAQTKLAKALLEYYQDTKHLSEKASNCVLSAALFGEGYILQTWDSAVGAVSFANIAEDGTREVVHEGDVDQRVFEPIDVIRDVRITDPAQNHWYMFREVRNKWDLAAKHPELADEIETTGFYRDPLEHFVNYIDYSANEESDLVFLYRFFHKKTASCPEGRYIEYLDESTILRDTTLDYEDFPVHRIADTDIQGINFAFTDAFDMLEIQSLKNGLWSTVMTNLRAFGVQNVLLPDGSNITESVLGGALNVISFDPSGPPPQALQLCAQPNGIFEAIAALDQKLETISGVNSTARGEPPAAVGSGVALSMLQSLNVQYAQGLQSSYVSGMEKVGTALINLLRKYSNVPRTIAVVGSANASYMKEFQGRDLENIHRVTVKLGNPMTNTPQGKFAMGEMLTSKGLIKDASQLLTVFETGSLDSLTDGRNAQLLLSKKICEALRNGEPVPEPVLTDDHTLMIRALADLSSDMDIRMNRPELLEPIFLQIQKHMAYLQNPSSSILMTVLGQQALPANPAPQAGGGANIDNSMTINAANPAAPQGPNINSNAVGKAGIATAQTQAPQTGNQPATGQLPSNFAQ